MESKGITVEIDYEKFIKALTDLIDQRIDKRLEKNKLTRFKEWLKDTEDYYSES